MSGAPRGGQPRRGETYLQTEEPAKQQHDRRWQNQQSSRRRRQTRDGARPWGGGNVQVQLVFHRVQAPQRRGVGEHDDAKVREDRQDGNDVQETEPSPNVLRATRGRACGIHHELAAVHANLNEVVDQACAGERAGGVVTCVWGGGATGCRKQHAGTAIPSSGASGNCTGTAEHTTKR